MYRFNLFVFSDGSSDDWHFLPRGLLSGVTVHFNKVTALNSDSDTMVCCQLHWWILFASDNALNIFIFQIFYSCFCNEKQPYNPDGATRIYILFNNILQN